MKKLFALITVAALVGCASVGRKIDQSAVDKIQKGTSSKEDVRKLIGSPDHVSRESGGEETWTYSYVHAQAKGSTFIPIVGAFAGGTDVHTQSVVVVFDQGGTVTKVTSTYGGQDVSNGLEAGGKPRVETDSGKRSR